MTAQPHKTLAEIKEIEAQKGGFESWKEYIDFQDKHPFPTSLEDAIDEANKIYYSQFVNPSIDIKDIDPEIGAAFNEFSKQNRRRTPKREREGQLVKKDDWSGKWYDEKEMFLYLTRNQYSEKIATELSKMWADLLNGAREKWMKKDEAVSSDVEQTLKGAPSVKMGLDDFYGYQTVLNLLRQSTQQPATINFFSEAEINTLTRQWQDETTLGEYDPISFKAGIYIAQSKLKERVNCVDIIDFARWFEDNVFIDNEDFVDDKLYGLVDHDKYNPNNKERFTGNEIIHIYLTPKTNPNGQK